MENQDRIDALKEALGLMEEAMGLVRGAVKGHDCEQNVGAYLLQSLKDCTGAEGANPYNQSIGHVLDLIKDEVA